MRCRKIVFGAVIVLLASSLVACDGSRGDGDESQPKRADADVRTAADRVVNALAEKDAATLAAAAGSGGVRFSPYAYVDPQSDVVLSAEELKGFWTDTETRVWGTEDGTGEPIELTSSAYCDRFVYDRDFKNASSVSVNADKAQGNTVNNAAEIYPEGSRVEYYIEPTEEDGQPGLDWSALRLVFEMEAGEWRLVGVIHDQWTI